MVEGERHGSVGANSGERQAFVCGHDQVGLVLRSGGKGIVDIGRACVLPEDSVSPLEEGEGMGV